MADILLTSLLDYITSKKDHIDGHADIDHVIDAKKRFFSSLNQYIDHRLSLKFEERRRSVSQSKISIADTLNSAMQSTASSVKSISALNSAPPPPININDKEAMKKWSAAYKEWYEGTRKKAMQIG